MAEIKRQRLGAIHLKKLELIKTEAVTDRYRQSTRVMYYPCKGHIVGASGNGGAHGHN